MLESVGNLGLPLLHAMTKILPRKQMDHLTILQQRAVTTSSRYIDAGLFYIVDPMVLNLPHRPQTQK